MMTTSEWGPSMDAYLSGREAMKNGEYQKAIANFEESTRISPHFKTLELLGECKIEVGEPMAAIVPLAAAIGLGTNEFRATYLLAVAFSKLGNTESALEYLERALKMNPEFKRARELQDLLMKTP